MSGFDFLVLFGLSYVVLLCEGGITDPPPGGKRQFFAKGSTAKIKWSFDDSVNISKIISRFWNFANSAGRSALIARISNDGDPDIKTSMLPGIAIEKPATLVLKDVDLRYSGTYTFTVGGDVSDSSKVTVFIVEKSIVQLSNCSSTTTVDTGDTLACLCKGKGGNPAPANVTWYDKDGAQIGGTGKEEKTLTFSNVHRNNMGRYKCIAKNHELAQNETSIELIVNFPPENVHVVFSTRMAERGKPFTITCEADALPSSEFEIFYNETKLLISQKTYTIPKVNNSHIGYYKCVAKNNLGSSNSTSRYLRVVNEGQSPTTFPTPKTSNESVGTHRNGHKKKGLGTGAIVGIVLGVLLLLVLIIVGVVYWFKYKSKEKNHEEEGNAAAPLKKRLAEANVYDAVATGGDDGEASTSTAPHDYATLEKPTTYAALDKEALRSSGSKKQNDGKESPTQYASIDVGKVGKVDKD